jgi:hypothetical protein
MDDPKKKRFLWGVLLACSPGVPTIIALGYVFRGISGTKATDITAVWAGLLELFVLWGIGTMLITQVTALILLFRAFERTRMLRSLFAPVSICLSGLMLLLIGLFLWYPWFQRHHAF